MAILHNRLDVLDRSPLQAQAAQLERAHILLQVSEDILAEMTVEGVLSRIADAACQVTDASLAIAGYGCQDGTFPVGAISWTPDTTPSPAEVIFAPAHERLFNELIRSGHSGRLTEAELSNLPSMKEFPTAHRPIRSLVTALLKGHDGVPVGIIVIAGKAEDDFTAADETQLSQLATLTSLALQHIESRQEAEHRAAELNAIFDALTDPLMIYTHQGVVRENRAVVELLGISLVELSRQVPEGRTAMIERLSIRSVDNQQMQIEELPSYRAMHGETVRGERLNLSTLAGRDVYVQSSAFPLWENGAVTGAVVTWHDVTEHERLLAETQRQQQVLEAIIEAAPASIAVLQGSEHRYVMVNQPYASVMGRGREVIGKTMAEAWPEEADHYIPILDRVYRNGEPRQLEELPVWLPWERDHQPHYYTFTYTPYRNSQSEVEGILMLCYETTDQIRARKCMEELVNQASDERTFLQAAIDVLPMPAIFLAGEESQGYLPVSCNKAAVEFREKHRYAGMLDLPLLDATTRTAIPRKRWPISRALRGKVTQGEEYLLATPDGAQLPIMYYASPIRINGKIVAAIGVINDITVLKEADRAKDEFLAVLSHELQTPLTSMLGWSDFALAKFDPVFMREAMEVIRRNARRQQGLVREMLDMSRIIHRKMELCFQPTDLRCETGMTVENLMPEAQRLGVELSFHGGDEPLALQADSLGLQQCIGNLIQNSIKFTPPDGSITVTCCRKEEMAMLVVQDTGRGIEPEMLASLFHPFRQVDRDERTGGLGLGLAVARGIIELHGGQISAASTGIGQGSTFTVILPLVQHQVQEKRLSATGSTK